MNKPSLRTLLLLTILSLSLSSCDRSVLFEENVRIPDNRWDAANVIKLEADIPDTAQLYNLYVNVRNAGGYPYSNIFLFLNTTLPDGKRSRDTLEVTLADDKGQWLGDGMGDIWDNRALFRERMRFPQSGLYTFEIEQAMRQNPLPQIMDVGLRIERYDDPAGVDPASPQVNLRPLLFLNRRMMAPSANARKAKNHSHALRPLLPDLYFVSSAS